MTRTGPNQDINDPTSMIEVAWGYQQVSNNLGDVLTQYNTGNLIAEGNPIVDVSIPLRIADGTTTLLAGTSIGYDGDGGYIYNSGLVSIATIATYVNLAERFREYWSIMNDVLDQLNNFTLLTEEEIDPVGPFVSYPPGGATRILGSFGGTDYTKKTYSHATPTDPDPVESRPIPEWAGAGPVNYSHLTYPQLYSALNDINAYRITIASDSWDTTYWYDKYSDPVPSVIACQASFGQDEDFGPLFSNHYIQFYNDSKTVDRSISIDMSVSAFFDEAASISYGSTAEIGDVNDFPSDWYYNQSSFIFDTKSISAGGGSESLTASRTVVIPPQKSAFIHIAARGASTFNPSSASINISLSLDGETVTHSLSI